MSALEVERVAEREGYASTILGRPCWIAQDMRDAAPRPRAECTPFTFTLATLTLPEGAVAWVDEKCGRYSLPEEGRFGYAALPDVKGQEQFMKALEKLERAAEAQGTEDQAAGGREGGDGARCRWARARGARLAARLHVRNRGGVVMSESWKVECEDCGAVFTEVYPDGLSGDESWADPDDPKPCDHDSQYALLERLS